MVRPWLRSDGQARDILERRDTIMARFEKEARTKGEAAVFRFRRRARLSGRIAAETPKDAKVLEVLGAARGLFHAYEVVVSSSSSVTSVRS